MAYLIDYLGDFATGSIDWPALHAWGRMTGRRIAAWEATALMTLDLIRKG